MNENVNKRMLKFSGICAIILAVSLAVIGILELCVLGLKNRLEYLEAGDRWSAGEEKYAVITLYTEDAFSGDQAEQWAYSMNSALINASIDTSEEKRAWAYTYIADDTLSITGTKGTTSADTIAAGGDFFVFHPMEFTYGSYFLNDDSNPRGIVIDRNLAWKLFGAENIVGMTAEINGIEFTVTGVCEPESTSGIYGYTYGTTPRLFMSYNGYSQATGNTSNLTMFEAALPNSVKGFAKNLFDGVIKLNEDKSDIKEATDRFSLKNRYNNMKLLKYSWIRENRIKYPYWENESKVYDYDAAIMMIFEVFFTAAAVVTLLLSIVCVKFSGYSVIYDIKRFIKFISAKLKKHRQNSSKLKKNKAKTENNTIGG